MFKNFEGGKEFITAFRIVFEAACEVVWGVKISPTEIKAPVAHHAHENSVAAEIKPAIYLGKAEFKKRRGDRGVLLVTEHNSDVLHCDRLRIGFCQPKGIFRLNKTTSVTLKKLDPML